MINEVQSNYILAFRLSTFHANVKHLSQFHRNTSILEWKNRLIAPAPF